MNFTRRETKGSLVFSNVDSPMSDFESGVDDHFTMVGDSFDVDLFSSEEGDDDVFSPPRFKSDAEYCVRDQKFRETLNNAQMMLQLEATCERRRRRNPHFPSSSTSSSSSTAKHVSSHTRPKAAMLSPTTAAVRKNRMVRRGSGQSSSTDRSSRSRESTCIASHISTVSTLKPGLLRRTPSPKRVNSPDKFSNDFWTLLAKFRNPESI